MKRLLMALLMVVLPVGITYAGTFSDDFDDGQLGGWHIDGFPRDVPAKVEIQNGYVVMDTREKPRELATLELKAGNAKNWNAYTFTCRVRIAGEPTIFSIHVRRGEGRFDLAADQTMVIVPLDQRGNVYTTPPDAKFNRKIGRIEGYILRGNFKVPIKLKRWYPIKIVANGDNFAFYFDNKLLTKYEDKSAVPGTVRFQADFGMVAHIDDVVITGPKVPNLAHSVTPKGHLTTTIWGKIKTDSSELQRQ